MKKYMRRAWAVLLACLLCAVCLAGCTGGQPSDEEPGDDPGKEEPVKERVIEAVSPADGGSAVLANEFVAAFADGYEVRDSEDYQNGNDIYMSPGLRLTWACQEEASSYTVALSRSQDMADAQMFSVTEEACTVEDLFVASEYFWRVTAKTEKGETVSDVFRFTTAMTPRTIYVEGVSNTRDIGGYAAEGGKRVRQGMLYRGAKLEDITVGGKEKLRTVYGIATDLDLRGDDGKDVLGGAAAYVHISSPSYLTPNDPHGSGIDVADNRQALAEIFGVFAKEESYPLYMHCAIGRDRTGTVAMLLLTLLGVGQDDVFMDYEMSLFSAAGCSDNTSVLKLITTYFRPTYNYIRDYAGGSPSENCERFLLDCGVTEEEIASIRSLLLV